MTMNAMNTTAQKIAELFENDGSIFELEDGTTMAEVCESHPNYTLEHDGESWRYAFSDDSALTGNAAGWDIEGSEPFAMLGAEIYD